MDGGWREVIKSKQIPAEYANETALKEKKKNEDRKAIWIDNYTDRVIAGENVESDAHIAEQYADEIKTVLAEKRAKHAA